MADPDKTADGDTRLKRSGLAAFAFLSRSLQQISTIVITLLAARFLLPAEYGVYALGVVFIMLIQTLTYTGFYQFVITSKEDDRRVLSVSFWLILGLAIAAALFLIALAWPIALFFDAPALLPVLMLMAAIQPIAGAGAWASAVLLRRGQVERHFLVMFLQNVIALVGGVILLWTWQSIYALVAFRYFRVLSGALLYFFMTRDRPALIFDRTLAREAMGFSGGLYGARFMNFLSTYSADLLLGAIYSTAEAGLYRFGSRIAGGAVDVVGQPMRNFSMTQFGAAARGDTDFAPVLARFTGSVTFLTGGVAAVLIVLGKPVVATLFDPAYLPALVVTYALAVRAVTMSALMVEPAFAAIGGTSRVMWFNTVWAVISVVSVFVAAQFGLEVLAWSQAVIGVVMLLSGLWVLERVGEIRINLALRAMAVALVLVLVYGVALSLTCSPIATSLVDTAGAQLAIGLAWALILALPVTYLASLGGAFTLRVFSG